MNTLTFYTPAHLDACAEIYLAAFSAAPISYTWLTLPKVREYLRDLAAAPKFAGFVYCADGAVVGFALGNVDDYFSGGVFEITEFAICPTRQRTGLGTRMLSDVCERLAAMDIRAVTLHTSRDIPAYDFYAANGFGVLEQAVTLFREL